MGLMLSVSGKICVASLGVFFPLQGSCVVLVPAGQCTGGAVAFISDFSLSNLSPMPKGGELVESTTLVLGYLPHPTKFGSIPMLKPTYHV